MSSGVENIKLGACDIAFGGEALGLTKGGVEISLTTETHTLTVDQFGDTALSQRITGRNIEVKVPMAETDVAKLAAIMPGAVLDESNGQVSIMVSEGLDLVKLAKPLTITPRADGDYPLTVLRAMTDGSLSFAYKYNEERIFEVTFKAYPDEAGYLMTVGDASQVKREASRAAAKAAN